MTVKSMFGSVVRKSGIPVTQNVALSLFVLEYEAATSTEPKKFYVSKVRSVDLNEARHLIRLELNAKKMTMNMVRMFSLGKDRSWLRGNNTYRVEILDTRIYCREIYEQIHIKNGLHIGHQA